MTLKSLLLSTLLCTVLSTAALADKTPAIEVRNVIQLYTDAQISADARKLTKILSPDAVVKFSKGDQLIVHKQSALLQHMKSQEGIQQNCSTNLTILASNKALVMAKVDFIYEDFTIENYLTIELDKNDNWKITNVNRFFTDAEGAENVLTSNR